MIRKRGTVEFKGQLITTAELARLHDLPVSTIAHRYWRGDRDDLLVRPTKTAKTKASCPTCGVEFVKINDQRRVFCSAACMKNRGGRGEAYDDWARCAFGEFACLNFPREGSNERSAI